jgi:hypothetical protein
MMSGATGRRLLLLGPALLTACAAASVDGNGDDTRACAAEPLGHMVAFLEEAAPPLSARLEGTLLASSAGADADSYRYVFRDATGTERRLVYRAPGGPLPLKPGVPYQLQVDYVGGAPAASGLLIRDRDGLVFAGATDQRLGARVLKEGVPDFALELRPPTCRSRPGGTCYQSIANQALRVAHGGRQADLLHGQSVRLGPYRITCLTAQSVVYRDQCADAGLPAVSYLMVRIE